MTYHARQADLTGGAANFFLATPLEGPAERLGVVWSVMMAVRTVSPSRRGVQRETSRETGKKKDKETRDEAGLKCCV